MTRSPHISATSSANGSDRTTPTPATRTPADTEMGRIMAVLETLQMEIRTLKQAGPAPRAAVPLLAPDPKIEILAIVQAANDAEQRGVPTPELRERVGFGTRSRLAHYLYDLEDEGKIVVVRGKRDKVAKRRGADVVYLASVMQL